MSVKVSIIIKALNEQDNIERVLRSALAAASEVNGEVILADSLSTDDTIEIAKKFPVKIVQLTNHHERCCGIGAQLGYQYAQGEFVYVLDADMEIEIEFLRQALELMATNHSLAGIGGILQEMHLDNLEFQARVQRAPVDMQAGDVNHISGGGLYRHSAIDEIGYLTNRNLHSYEEFELGIRLRTAGWRLVRLPIISVKHYGHTMPAYRLLRKRWKSRYSQGLGELIRASFGKDHMSLLMREMTDIKLYLGVMFWWMSLLMILVMVRPWSIMLAMFISLLALPFVAMVIKKGNFPLGIYSVVAWQYLSAGMVLGLMRKQINPSESIASNVLN
ncbi:glycosyltransferase [Methylotenera sp. L2L1]|uniref:glycosyltransferase n=1 Tax=Methylotenera sp. L2L1 TaxID=1502770 RepID=UPI00056D2CA8|nr:glycosyltransferase [Methylotenera sp. L2L1]